MQNAGQGPNPWKTVTLFEELRIPYETIFLEFGSGPKGVEADDFKQKNPAGRVPLIYDPNTGASLRLPQPFQRFPGDYAEQDFLF